MFNQYRKILVNILDGDTKITEIKNYDLVFLYEKSPVNTELNKSLGVEITRRLRNGAE